jgi:hypothetical protein
VAQYKEATISDSSLEAFAMDVEFEVFNTNDEPLQLMMYNYTVVANGAEVFRGHASAEKTVPRWSSTLSSVPVVIRRDLVGEHGHVVWSLHGTLGYVPTRELSVTLLETGIWKPTTSVRANGMIEVPSITN